MTPGVIFAGSLLMGRALAPIEQVVGAWKQFQDSFPAKFIIIGALYYFVGCFQGSTEALREMQRLTHFTDFVIGHSHLTVFGTFVIWATAGMYWVTPRLAGRELYSKSFAQWHYWLTVVGFSIMAFIILDVA